MLKFIDMFLISPDNSMFFILFRLIPYTNIFSGTQGIIDQNLAYTCNYFEYTDRGNQNRYCYSFLNCLLMQFVFKLNLNFGN